MKNIFYLILSFIMVSSANADDANLSANENNVIVKTIEKNIVKMPDCNDENLVKAVKDFIVDFYNKNKSYNVFERRRKFFILDNLSYFSRENLDNYKTEKAKPISDILIDLKINQAVIEENIYLCRNNNKNVTDFYVLVYYANDVYNVKLINLKHKQPAHENISFIYKGENK